MVSTVDSMSERDQSIMALENYEEIVNNFLSPTLVRAGPGAGKTYLLADRIRRLLDKGTDKATITVLTFGTDASQHMYNELVDRKGKFQIKPEDLRTYLPCILWG